MTKSQLHVKQICLPSLILNVTNNNKNTTNADIIMGFSQGRGGTPLYLPYRYVPPQKGMDFAYFGLNLGKVFKGIQECVTCLSFQRPNE